MLSTRRSPAGLGSVVVWSQTDDGIGYSAEAAVKPDNQSFLSAQTVSPAGEVVHAPQVAVGEDGTAVVAWYAAFGDGVAAAIGHASAAGFQPGVTLSPPGMAASDPQPAVDDRGNALVIWTAGEGAAIQSAYRPRRGEFEAAQEITTEGVFEPQVAFDESGNAHAVWTHYTGDLGQIETAFRPSGGSFGEPLVISNTPFPLDNFEPQIAADDARGRRLDGQHRHRLPAGAVRLPREGRGLRPGADPHRHPVVRVQPASRGGRARQRAGSLGAHGSSRGCAGDDPVGIPPSRLTRQLPPSD